MDIEKSKDILISIVNGNDKGFIYDCVKSIQEHTVNISYDIVVIDNCTGDVRLSELDGMGVKLIVNKAPMGFARNHAQVLPLTGKYRYLLLFNDDAFLQNDAFSIMVECADADHSVVIAGCKILDPDGQDQPSAAPFPTLSYFVKNSLGLDQRPGQRYSEFFADYIDYGRTQYVDWVSGCCMLIDGEYLARYGFLDVGYFMFLEDADLCRTARDAGFKVKYISEALITHLGGGSSKDEKRLMRPALYLETQRSRLRYLRKESYLRYFAYFVFINTLLVIKLLRSLLRGRQVWVKELLRELPGRPLR